MFTHMNNYNYWAAAIALVTQYIQQRKIMRNEAGKLTLLDGRFVPRNVPVTNWHFSRSFRLIFLNIYDHYPSDLILSSSPHSFKSISPSNFVSDHQENQTARVFSPINVANTTLRLQRTARFKTKRNDKTI